MGFRSVLEDINLKTKSSLKDNVIQSLPDADLLALNAATRAGVASGLTGLSIQGTLSCAGLPTAMVAAAVNACQSGVAFTNRNRVSREVKRRAAIDPRFRALLEQVDKPFRDILIGSGVKCITSVLTIGIADFLDASSVIGSHLADAGTAPGLSESAQFQLDHPNISATDGAVVDIAQGPSNALGQMLGDHTGNLITDNTTMAQIAQMHMQGSGMGGLMAQTAAVGVAGEANPVPLALEYVAGHAHCDARRDSAKVARCKQHYGGPKMA